MDDAFIGIALVVGGGSGGGGGNSMVAQGDGNAVVLVVGLPLNKGPFKNDVSTLGLNNTQKSF